MHTFIKIVALYASIMTLASAMIFVGYLEVYSWFTRGDIITSFDSMSWRTLLPKLSMWTMIFGGIISSIATLANIAGF